MRVRIFRTSKPKPSATAAAAADAGLNEFYSSMPLIDIVKIISDNKRCIDGCFKLEFGETVTVKLVFDGS